MRALFHTRQRFRHFLLQQRRNLADRGPLRKDYSDPNFQKGGYIDPGNFLYTTRQRNTNKAWKPPQYIDSLQAPSAKRANKDLDARKRRERENDVSDYPFTGSRLDRYPRKKADDYYFQDGESESYKTEKEKQNKNKEENEDEDDEISVRDRFEIQKTLAEDASERGMCEQSFYKPEFRLFDISGNMDEDWQPSTMDDTLVFEMGSLFKQGNVATWEAEDVVRSFGGQLRPYHVFEVIKNCKPAESRIALAFFRWASLQPDYFHVTATYNMMLKLLQEDKKYTEMVKLVQEMEAAEVPYSTETFKILLVSFFKAGFLEEALETFSKMEKSDRPPLYNEYKYVIDRMLNSECYAVVPYLFKSLTAAGHLPDSYAYNAVISSLCNMAKMDEAIALFKTMKKKSSIDLFTYTILIDGYIKCHNAIGATKLFVEMLERGCLPGEDIFNLLFGLHVKSGDIDQAVNLFMKLAENGCQPTVKSYSMLVDTFATVDDIQSALGFFRELIGKKIYPSAVACNNLLSKLSKAGKSSLALEFFQDTKEFPESKPNGITYNIAIDLYGRIGRYHEAWSEFESMKNTGCSPCVITYNTLIIRLGRGGLIEEVFDLYEEMRSRGISPNQYTYCGLIDVLTRYNEVGSALEFLEEMQRQQLMPSFNTLQLLLKGLWKNGYIEAANKLCVDYPGVYTSPQLESRAWATQFGARQLAHHSSAIDSAMQLSRFTSMVEQ